jgi:D-alanyl-D-alanine dipeptidase
MTALLLALALIAPAQHAPRTFVALEDVDPTILQDMRYAAKYNFVGRRIDGYREPLCILTRGAARALERAQSALAPKGYTLKVYDCYRPQRAVDHFARWADDTDDTKMKREFYPRLDKGSLHDDGYIAHRSGHSRGSTVDLTLVKLPPKTQPRWSRKRFGLVPCFAPRRKRFPDNSVSMGTAFDCFDPRAHTLDPRITGRPHRNRLLLRDTLDAAGFDDYANEWWHFTLRGERYPARYFDFPVARRSLK